MTDGQPRQLMLRCTGNLSTVMRLAIAPGEAFLFKRELYGELNRAAYAAPTPP